MLRIIGLVSLLVSSAMVSAHDSDGSPIHGAFWVSSNGNPVLDGNGDCVRTGSYEALGSPQCTTEVPAKVEEPAAKLVEMVEMADVDAMTEASEMADIEETKLLETSVEPTAMDEPKTSSEKAVMQEPAAKPQTEPETMPAAVTYSFPVEQISANVYFDFDKNNLRVDQQENIERALIESSKANKLLRVRLEGHADSSGSDEYNIDLSQSRINTVVNYLKLRSIQTDSTVAWGEEKLVLNADGSENYDLSRRVEMTIFVQQKVAK